MGKDSTWAKLLGVNYLYDDATDKNAAIDRGVINYSAIKNDKVRKDIGDILFNFADWENATGKYAPGSETPSSNRVKNKVDRYVALRKFAEVLAEQPSQGSELTNRLNIAIDSADKLLNLSREDYDQAYNQLRKSLINEMTMYNIAFFKNIKIDLSTFEGGEGAKDLAGEIQDKISITDETKEIESENGGEVSVTEDADEIPTPTPTPVPTPAPITTTTVAPSLLESTKIEEKGEDAKTIEELLARIEALEEQPTPLTERQEFNKAEAERMRKLLKNVGDVLTISEEEKIATALKEVNRILERGKKASPSKSRDYFKIMELPTSIQKTSLADYEKVRDYLLELQKANAE